VAQLHSTDDRSAPPARGQELLEAIDACHACRDLAAWPSVVVEVLRELIPCDVSAFNDFDPAAERYITILSKPSRMPDGWETAWASYGHQNPAYSKLIHEGDVGPLRLSDFVRQPQLRATELYRLIYAPLGVRYQIATALEGPEPQITAIVLMRDKRDFTGGELELLRLIRPHLRRSYDNARDLAGLARRSADLEAAAARANIRAVSIGPQDEALSATAPAAELLRRHYGDTGESAVPEPIATWAATALATRDPSFCTFSTPAGRLRASLVPASTGAVILLDEVVPRPSRGAALTAREEEILDTISVGATNLEAARTLGISATTVAKHLQNIYRKLGVSNRVAALNAYQTER
jgi:DNA-binding CsgD family transcriptional regulator